jgi:hypothetical protein
VIHYHGLPITPDTAAVAAVNGGHAFVSIAHPEQLTIAMEVCQSFAVDNGAFSAWKAGKETDWNRFYCWVADLHRRPGFDFAVIPDVIDGSEDDNDELLSKWPWKTGRDCWIGAPVWHMNESMDRLLRLALEWPRVCIGSSGEYSQIGTQHWWSRMNEAMNTVCDREGLPICKLHGLRMLDPKVFSRFPFHSADSTNIGRNIGIDSAWKGTYTPPTKQARAMIMRQRIESFNSICFWDRKPIQTGLFA